MNWAALDKKAAMHGLFVMGALHDNDDTVVLIGAGSGMWPLFSSSTEAQDTLPNPLDRWSKRVIGGICTEYGATSVFPSDGPPYAPFIAWATVTGRFWQSPTGMLIHDVAGLMISIRGAMRLEGLLELPLSSTQNPCDTCAAKPCLTACPIGALSGNAQYDVPACKTYLASDKGRDCMQDGCFTRRACPVSDAFGRDPVQSAFHMAAFMP